MPSPSGLSLLDGVWVVLLSAYEQAPRASKNTHLASTRAETALTDGTLKSAAPKCITAPVKCVQRYHIEGSSYEERKRARCPCVLVVEEEMEKRAAAVQAIL
jgi:hypothetical protein